MILASFAKRAFIGASLATLGLALLPATSLAQGLQTIRSDVVVSQDTILLGDIVTNAGPAGSAPVFRAPALGRSGTIQMLRVLEAAIGAGMTGIDPGAASQIVVTRAARRIEKQDIAMAVSAALSRHGLDQAEVSIALDNGDAALFVEPEAKGEIRIADLSYDPRSLRVEAVVAVAGSRSLALKPARITGTVVDSVEAPVLLRNMQRGETVRISDIKMDRRPRRDAAIGAADPAALIGKVARNQLQAGAVLREADLTKQELVEKNGAVQVVYEAPGLALAMRGKALEGGGMGDVVLIQNIQSKRNLQATVTGPGRVSVTGGMPGRLAAAQSGVTAQ